MTWHNLVLVLQIFFLCYVVLLFGSYGALFCMALRPFRDRALSRNSWIELSQDIEVWPPITVVLPAYNEEAVIVDCVRTTLALDYPALEVIVVCDGPKDRTFEVLVEQLELSDVPHEPRSDFKTKAVVRIMGSPVYPNLRVILKENGGKADALNVGLNAARTPLVCCCDADTLIEPPALRRLVRPFQENPNVVATSGALMLTNGATFENGRPVSVRAPRNWLAAVQVLEYVRAFYLGRMGFEPISSMLIISGAFGLFSRHALVDIGGYNHATVGEDMDLVVRIHRHFRQADRPYHIAYVPSAVAWTEAPESLKMLKSQRMRWQRGLCEVLSMHRGMPFQRNAGLPGTVGFAYFTLFEALAPVIEVVGYCCFVALFLLGYANWNVWAAMFALSVSMSSVITLAALLIQQRYAPVVSRPSDLGRLLLASCVEMFFFKPLSAFWRVRATVLFIRGRQAKWDPIARKGFKAEQGDTTTAAGSIGAAKAAS
jgi:cellulose synthase/poly-beta-1,6-N-acetylglucosamine synthase-like glycosyltransferase